MKILPFEYIKSETCLETCGIPEIIPIVDANSLFVARVTFQKNTRYILPEDVSGLNSLRVYHNNRIRPGNTVEFRQVVLRPDVRVANLEQIDQVVLAFK